MIGLAPKGPARRRQGEGGVRVRGAVGRAGRAARPALPAAELVARLRDEMEQARLPRMTSPPICLRYSGVGSPPTPQFSSSTSWMITKVSSGGLFSTSTSRSVAPLMRAAFCSAVAPSRVTWMVTIGMAVSS